jgi:hypothetical protein
VTWPNGQVHQGGDLAEHGWSAGAEHSSAIHLTMPAPTTAGTMLSPSRTPFGAIHWVAAQAHCTTISKLLRGTRRFCGTGFQPVTGHGQDGRATIWLRLGRAVASVVKSFVGCGWKPLCPEASAGYLSSLLSKIASNRGINWGFAPCSAKRLRPFLEIVDFGCRLDQTLKDHSADHIYGLATSQVAAGCGGQFPSKPGWHSSGAHSQSDGGRTHT